MWRATLARAGRYTRLPGGCDVADVVVVLVLVAQLPATVVVVVVVVVVVTVVGILNVSAIRRCQLAPRRSLAMPEAPPAPRVGIAGVPCGC